MELDLKKLQSMKLPDLTKIAEDFKLKDASDLKKQGLIFGILAADSEKNGQIFRTEYLKYYLTATDFYVHRTTIICRVRMTFIYLLLR